MSESNGTKTEGKPTVAISDLPCVLCEKDKPGDTVMLNASAKGFKGAVCTEHLLGLLKKWQRSSSSVPTKPS